MTEKENSILDLRFLLNEIWLHERTITILSALQKIQFFRCLKWTITTRVLATWWTIPVSITLFGFVLYAPYMNVIFLFLEVFGFEDEVSGTTQEFVCIFGVGVIRSLCPEIIRVLFFRLCDFSAEVPLDS